MTQNSGNSGMWVIILAVVGFAMLLNLIGGNSGGTTAPPVNRNSVEHRYATERLKREGYSNSEAQQAADAIIKFHNAQQNR
jgi:hypothetical protein